MSAWWVPVVLISLLVGCDDGPPPGPEPKAAPAWTESASREADALEQMLRGAAPTRRGDLTVRLAFGEDADLDLYVTGPFEETVYYANTPSEIGGALVEDRRCVHAGPRVEIIRFPSPLTPGRYRVGVDYPHACSESTSPAPFVIDISEPGGRVVHRGLARHRVFEPIVVEVESEVMLDVEAEAAGTLDADGVRDDRAARETDR